MQHIDFDNKRIAIGANEPVSFAEAITQGIITQEQLDKEEMRFVKMALIDIEEAGFEDVTEEANEQNKSHHWYVFSNARGVHYCDTVEDILDLAETL